MSKGLTTSAKIKWRWMLLGYALLLVYASLRESSSTGVGWFPHQDKLAHCMAYMILAYLANQAFNSIKEWLWFAILFAFGMSMEVLQSMLPYRQASLLDSLANGAGIAFGLAMSSVFKAGDNR